MLNSLLPVESVCPAISILIDGFSVSMASSFRRAGMDSVSRFALSVLK